MRAPATSAPDQGGGREQSAAPGEHAVRFYEDDASLIDMLAGYVGGGIAAGDAVVVIATDAHRRSLEAQLRARGVTLSDARGAGRYVALDASETLASFMDEDGPDPVRFRGMAEAMLARAAACAPRVRVFGEMVAELWSTGRRDAALALECLWSALSREHSFSLLCAYPLGASRSAADESAFAAICAEHRGETPGRPPIPDVEAHVHRVADLQDRTRILAAECDSRHAAEEACARLAAIVESSDDAIIGKTLEGTVTSWNRGAERIFGYRADEMIGQPILRIIPPDRAGEEAHILATIGRGDLLEHFETERVCKDGRRICISLTVSPIRDSSGRIIGASKIARDITDRKAAEEERRSVLEDANRAKDRFLALLCHELRTPLAAVNNAILALELDPDRRERAIGIARHGLGQLTRLVDDLLDVARIAQGRITLRSGVHALNEIVDRAIDLMRSLFEERSLAVTLSLPPCQLMVEGDPARLEQVLVNLLANAAKFTDAGGRITVTLEADGDEAVLRVRDTGIGVDPALLSRIFDLFMQADQSLDRSRGGLGIGLTLVRQLVELHGGRVTAHSAGLGHGAEFVVRLPAVARTAKPAGAAVRPVPAPVRHGDTRVIIVEDNADAAESLMMLLELLGLRVRVVPDGPAALEAARANVPDAMLIDIGLPGMDGYELARQIRADPLIGGVTLVALTGYGQEEDRQRALAAGFDYHLVKPLDVERFQRLVAGISSQKQLLMH